MGLLLFRWVIGFLLCLLGFCFLVNVGASRLLCRGLFGCCLVLLWIDASCCLLVLCGCLFVLWLFELVVGVGISAFGYLVCGFAVGT